MAQPSDNQPLLLRIVRLHGLLLAALAFALLVAALTAGDWRWPTRAAAGWDAGVSPVSDPRRPPPRPHPRN